MNSHGFMAIGAGMIIQAGRQMWRIPTGHRILSVSAIFLDIEQI
jgi:hypothetical protein